MIRWLLQSTLCLILCPLLAAQEVAPPATPAPATATHSRTVRIKKDTPVTLRLEQIISSADAKVGDKVHFTLMGDLVADGQLIAPAGTSLFSTITFARPKADHWGRVVFSIPEIDFGHGKQLQLTDADPQLRKDNRELGVILLTMIILTSPISVPMYLSNMAERSHQPQPAVKTGKKREPQEQIYQEGRQFHYFVQHTLKIHMDQLGISNASAQVQ